MEAILIQAIGFVGMLLMIYSYQVKSNKGLYIWQNIASVAFVVQTFLLGGITGCIGMIIIIIRNALFTKMDKWRWVQTRGFAAVIIAVTGINTLLTWNGFISLLPWAAIIAGTIGYMSNNAQNIRLANLVCGSPCWMIYYLCVGSIGGVFNEMFTLGSIFVSIYRYGWKSMGENKFDKSADVRDGDNMRGNQEDDTHVNEE